jgi:uncharacterized protein (TIGR03067 family)
MFSRVMAFLVLVVVAAPAGSAPKGGDAELLEGEWVSKTYENYSGRQGAAGVWMLVFKGGKMGMTSGSEPPQPDCPVTFDSARSPKQFDVAWKSKKNREPQQYIYKLDGDTLTICHAQPDQPRPTEFKGGKGQHCWVFTRVRPKEKK